MGYFNNPKTEEELDNQCRALLKKYNYRSGQSNPTIERILQEYKTLKMEIKRANGYRTPREEIVSFAKEVSNDSKQKRANEQARVSALQNHKYSKAEMEQLIFECKKCLDIMLKETVQEEKFSYIGLQNVVSESDPEYVLRWFNRRTDIFTNNKEVLKRYDIAREKLEYAFKSMATNKRTQETYMLQMEKSLGNYIITRFKEYEDMYLDPIKVAEREQKVNKKKNDGKRITTMCGWGYGFTIGFIFVAFGSMLGITGTIIGLVVGIIVMIIFAKGYIKMVNSLNKKRLGGMGKRKQLSRMSEKNEFKAEQKKVRVVKLIGKIFGL